MGIHLGKGKLPGSEGRGQERQDGGKSENKSSPESTEPGGAPGWSWGGHRSLGGVMLSLGRRGGEQRQVLFFILSVFLTIQICFIWQ